MDRVLVGEIADGGIVLRVGEAAGFVDQEPTPDLGGFSMPRFGRFDNTFV